MYAVFTIPGKPKGKDRPRLGRGGRIYTPKETKAYEELVAYQFLQSCRGKYFGDDPVKVCIDAYFEIPKSYTKKKRKEIEECRVLPTGKPDIDNIAKIICDGLNGVAFEDDKQVVEICCKKHYTEHESFVAVSVESVGDRNGGEQHG